MFIFQNHPCPHMRTNQVQAMWASSGLFEFGRIQLDSCPACAGHVRVAVTALSPSRTLHACLVEVFKGLGGNSGRVFTDRMSLWRPPEIPPEFLQWQEYCWYQVVKVTSNYQLKREEKVLLTFSPPGANWPMRFRRVHPYERQEFTSDRSIKNRQLGLRISFLVRKVVRGVLSSKDDRKNLSQQNKEVQFGRSETGSTLSKQLNYYFLPLIGW